MQRCTGMPDWRISLIRSFFFLGLCFGPVFNSLTAHNHTLNAGAGETAFLSNRILPTPICIGQVNVSLQENCQAELTVDKVLLGFSPDADLSEYTLSVKDGDESNEYIVDGCRNYEYVVTGPEGFSCWGFVSAEDKEAPKIGCPEPAFGNKDQFFLCKDIQELLLDGIWEYTTDQDGNVVEIPEALNAILQLTGFPQVQDNCGDLLVTVRDQIQYPDDICEPTIITRTFTVKDACKGLTATCSQKIHIGVPDLEDVIPPVDGVELACDEEVKLDANGNPHPDETGYPSVQTAFALYAIDQSFCNLGASYQDGERIWICESSYKLVRHWQVLDWCHPEEIGEFTQIIKIGDYEGPIVSCPEVDYDHDGNLDPLIFSSGPYDCTATFAVPLPQVEDNCSGWTVLTEILSGGAEGPVVAVILPGKDRYVSGIPLGCHAIRYTVIDNCTNKTVIVCPFFVEDQVAPIAVCNDDLHISLGGEGYARVSAAEIDEGSSDNCGPILVEARRRIKNISEYECLGLFDLDGNGVILYDEVRLSIEFGDPDGDGVGDFFYYTQWEPFVDFTCCDMNEDVRIELRVWDDRNGNGFPGDDIALEDCFNYTQRIVQDNYNVCWLDVLIEDKIAPTCIPPLPVEIDCDQLPYNFDPQDEALMTKLFGGATGYDNCPGWIVRELEAVTDDLDDCDSGSFTRHFQVTDAKGISSTVCQQLVTIYPVNDYWIGFPADAQANCGTPMVDTVMTIEGACDLLAISVKEETFSASGEECYKIFRTYSVINWCEYDGESAPVVVSRDEDCDGQPGDEAVYVIVMTLEEADPCYDYYGLPQAGRYQHVWYDRDNDPFNLLPQAGTKGESCEYESNPAGFWKEVAPITENEDPDQDGYPGNGKRHCEIASVGYWQYTQVVKVYDNVDPVILFTAPDPFCSYSSDPDQGCPAEVSINFQIEENCTPEDVTITAVLDAYGDGIIDGDITALLTSNYTDFQLNGSFPLGLHRLLLTAADGCGNKTQSILPFEVIDCKAPTPLCINGLAIELMPVIPAADVDGDGDIDNGAMTIWASDFIASPSSDCSGTVTYSINRSGAGNDPNQTSLTLTCDDYPTALIQIWAYDEAGNTDLCETYLFVEDNMVQCGAGTGNISGTIATASSTPVRDVQLALSGQSLFGATTQTDGSYGFDHLELGFDYTLTPQKDSDPLEGVTTFDLVLMSKHILGLQLLESPYQRIAADINNDKRITAMDAIALRKVILNIDLQFTSNTSWRFIPWNYTFPQPANPWIEAFPEVINMNHLEEDWSGQDFVGIKVGDLNGDTAAGALTTGARSASGRYSFQLEELEMTAGEIYQVDFQAPDLEEIQGFQATIELDVEQVELLDIQEGVAGLENFGLRYLKEGLLTLSWNRNGDQMNSANQVVFSLSLRARRSGALSQSVALNSRQISAEAYDQSDQILALGLVFDDNPVEGMPVVLEQNTPNPFRRETTIGFYLPAANEVSVAIYDAQGRLVRSIRNAYKQGRHTMKVQAFDLGATGVLYYTFTSGTFTATRKMILLE